MGTPKSLSGAMLHALPVGHEFDGYRILSVLGAGGFGITCLAEGISIGRRVAIKEFLPQSIARRETTSFNVRPLSAASAAEAHVNAVVVSDGHALAVGGHDTGLG
jgi:hypothetical protein